MNELNEYAARLERLLREGLDLASRVDNNDPITPALRDWHHEAAEYLRRYQDEALARWENNRGEPT